MEKERKRTDILGNSFKNFILTMELLGRTKAEASQIIIELMESKVKELYKLSDLLKKIEKKVPNGHLFGKSKKKVIIKPHKRHRKHHKRTINPVTGKRRYYPHLRNVTSVMEVVRKEPEPEKIITFEHPSGGVVTGKHYRTAENNPFN